MIYRQFVKRLLDVMIAICVLVLCSPLFLMIAIAIKLDSPGPVIFQQKRIGYKGRVFTFYKFRSMKVNSEHTGSGVYSDENDDRVTKTGWFLRRMSLDELPQALNVLRGDMSLIGPRPPLTYHPWPIEDYTEEQLRMFDVRPGITGWAQIHGRKAVEWHERIAMNVWYVDNLSILLDCKIFFATIFKVLRNEDNVNVGATVAEEAREDSEALVE